MDRKGVLIIAASILAAAGIIGLSQAWAQHSFRTDPRLADGTIGRYVVVNVTESEVIIMDTTSGDLYSAKARDVKPFEARPRPRSFSVGNGTTTTTGQPYRPPTTTTTTGPALTKPTTVTGAPR